MLKSAANKVQTNVIGAILGAGATYFAVKKYSSISKTYIVVSLAVLGGVVGAYAQGAITAKKSTPSKDTVKK
jgi:glycopeptide antibiotics resistance protein